MELFDDKDEDSFAWEYFPTLHTLQKGTDEEEEEEEEEEVVAEEEEVVVAEEEEEGR